MITTLDMVWKGLAIGVIISAPMGPVGMLCIQKTISKGRKVGLLTGVGATLSDLFYCLITGFGLSLIEEFLERNQSIIQIFGSIVLIGFGIYLYRQKQPREFHPKTTARASLKKDTLSGFLFTLSNPLIIFLIIGLFARFNFLLPEMKFYHYFVGYVAIAGGALLWWWFITFTIDKIRAHFNQSVQRFINRLIGIIIMIFGVVGVITASVDIAKASEHIPLLNPTETYLTNISIPPASQSGQPAIEIPLPDTISPCRVLFHVDSKTSSSNGFNFLSPFARKKASQTNWELRLYDSSDMKTGVAIRAESVERETFAGTASEPGIRLSAFSLPARQLLAQSFPEKLRTSSPINAYILNVKGNHISLFADGNSEEAALDLTVPSDALSSMTLQSLTNDSIRLSYFSASLNDAERERFLARALEAHVDSLTHQVAKAGMPHYLNGQWKLYSANFPTDNIEIGGEYQLSIDTPAEGIHAVRYLSGAIKHPADWTPGRLKGVLTNFDTPGNFYLDWIDAEGRLMREYLVASFDPQTNLLTLKFPNQQFTISLIKTSKTGK